MQLYHQDRLSKIQKNKFWYSRDVFSVPIRLPYTGEKSWGWADHAPHPSYRMGNILANVISWNISFLLYSAKTFWKSADGQLFLMMGKSQELPILGRGCFFTGFTHWCLWSFSKCAQYCRKAPFRIREIWNLNSNLQLSTVVFGTKWNLAHCPECVHQTCT